MDFSARPNPFQIDDRFSDNSWISSIITVCTIYIYIYAYVSLHRCMHCPVMQLTLRCSVMIFHHWKRCRYLAWRLGLIAVDSSGLRCWFLNIEFMDQRWTTLCFLHLYQVMMFEDPSKGYMQSTRMSVASASFYTHIVWCSRQFGVIVSDVTISIYVWILETLENNPL